MTSLARNLLNAIETKTPIESPRPEDLDVERAYQVQEELLASIGGGEPIAVKLGLTSKAKQAQMKVNEPIYGWLPQGSQVPKGAPLNSAELIQPRGEPEIAFLIAEDLAGPDISVADVLARTSALMPAVDILDSRYTGYSFTLPAVIADNASAGRFILGDPVSVAGLDLRTLGCVFSHNGVVSGTAAGAAVMGHPAAAVAWLVAELAARGRVLPAGTVVLSGALTAAVPLEIGDSLSIELDRIGSLSLTVE